MPPSTAGEAVHGGRGSLPPDDDSLARALEDDLDRTPFRAEHSKGHRCVTVMSCRVAHVLSFAW